MGGKAQSPQKRGFVKEDSNDGDKGVMEGPGDSQSTVEVEESGGGEESNLNKTVMEVVEGVARLVGVDLAGHGDRAENHRFGGVDKEGIESGSLVLGVQNLSQKGGLIWSHPYNRSTCTTMRKGLG